MDKTWIDYNGDVDGSFKIIKVRLFRKWHKNHVQFTVNRNTLSNFKENPRHTRMIYIWSPITYHSHKIDCLIITFKYEIPMKHSNQKQSNTHDTKNQYHQHHASMVIFVTYLYLSVLRILSTCFSYLYLIWILKIYTVANHYTLYVLIRYDYLIYSQSILLPS